MTIAGGPPGHGSAGQVSRVAGDEVGTDFCWLCVVGFVWEWGLQGI